MNVLVVGGAGYIGSHCVRQLTAAGHRPVVLDNLVYGHRGAVAPGVELYAADLGDEAARLLEPGVAVTRRTSPGGAGPGPVAVQLERFERRIGVDRSRLAIHEEAEHVER